MAEQPGGAAGRPPLFCYGTLRCAPVLRALLGRVPDGGPDGGPDAAPGWRAAALRGRVYPGLVPGPGAAAGRVLTGLASGEWRILDAFEGEEYVLRRLTLASGRPAVAYVWLGGAGPGGPGTGDADVLPADWDLADFRRRHLADYARRLRRAAR